MPENSTIPPPPPPIRDRWSWVPDGLSTILLLAIAMAVGWFFQLFWRLRFRIGMDPKMALGLAIGLFFIELYLIRRVMVQGKKTRRQWAASRALSD